MEPRITIYQLKDTKETKYLHDKSLEELQSFGMGVEFDNYEVVMDKPADPEDVEAIYDGKIKDVLEYYYDELSKERFPEGYTGHALCIADIIALTFDGESHSYYVDSRGFLELIDFFPEGFQMQPLKGYGQDDFGELPGFQQGPAKQSMPEPNYEMHFYTSLYIDMGKEMSQEEAKDRMEDYLQELKRRHPEFAFTIHDAEAQEYYD